MDKMIILLNLLCFILLKAEKYNYRDSVLSQSYEILRDIQAELSYVPIIKVPSGFHVLPNFSPNTGTANITNLFNTNETPMLLGLYTSATLLVTNCQKFLSYQCEDYPCINFPDNKTAQHFPYFDAQGHFIKPAVYLDNLNWNLETKTIIAQNCIHSYDDNYGSGTYGIVGMGVTDSSWANYRGQVPLFSIYLDQEGNDGQLLFRRDLNKAAEKNLTTSVIADNNWRISNVSGIQVESHVVPMNLNLMFDLNSDVIGLPLEQYQNVLDILNKNEFGMQCSTGESKYKPTCNYQGQLNKLPDINIEIGEQIIIIPPEIYLENALEDKNSEDYTLTLNLRAVDSSLKTPENYVTNYFNDFIILGSCVMKYYYIVFDGTLYLNNKTNIEFYRAILERNNKDSTNPDYKVFIIVIIVAVVMAVLIVKRTKRREVRPVPTSNNLSSINPVEELSLFLEDSQGKPNITSVFPKANNSSFNESDQFGGINLSRDTENTNYDHEQHERLLSTSTLRSDNLFDETGLASSSKELTSCDFSEAPYEQLYTRITDDKSTLSK